MTTITMTIEQTETYDASGEAAERLMRQLRAQAHEQHEQTGETVEIHTADGIVIAVAQ